MKRLLLILLLFLFLGGCTDYNEVNNLTIVDMIGIEKQEDTYHLYLSVVTGEKEENKTQNKHTVYHVTGKSLGEAFQEGETINNKRTYYNHLAMVFIHSSLLENREEYQELFSFLKKKLEQGDYLLLEGTSPLASFFELYPNHEDLENFILKEKETKGTTTLLTFDEVNANDFDQEYDAYLPSIQLEENTLKTNGITLLGGNMHYDDTSSRISYLLSNKIKEYSFLIPIEEKYYQIKLSDLHVNLDYQENTFKITIKGQLESEELPKEKRKEVQEETEKNLTKEIKQFIEMEQEQNISTTPLKNLLYFKTKKTEAYQKSKTNITLSFAWKGDLS